MALKIIYLVLYFYSNFSDAVKYIGCYKETPNARRIMTGDFKDFPKTLTPDVCIRYCRRKNMDYAGLQNRHQCFCDQKRPPYVLLTEQSDCNMKCEGDQRSICGGYFRISVYDVTGKHSSNQSANYLGCFEESTDESRFTTEVMVFQELLTPEFCMGQCLRIGFRFAGLQFGFECHCGDEMTFRYKTNDLACASPCPGDQNLHCGADMRMAVYKTAIPDVPSTNKLLGCYKDEGTRLLSGSEFWLDSTNSPNKCINMCLSLGYKYSGVEYGVQCFCGNEKPRKNKKALEEECDYNCPFNIKEYCGGLSRIMVYKTGVMTHKDLVLYNLFKPGTSQASHIPSSSNSLESHGCSLSLTSVNSKRVCSGTVIFSEDFNNSLSRQIWMQSLIMPTSPDYEFVAFTKSKHISFTQNGKLIIKPKLFDDGFIRGGKLHLLGCTGLFTTEQCLREANGFSILPPVESARFTTKESFSFRYGRVDIRARLPMGDWVYPELWLEPKKPVYGPEYSSGRIRIATARGNPSLTDGKKDLSNNLLESGVLVGLGDKVKDLTVQRVSRRPWSSDFHNYSVIWTPDNLEFLVDGQKTEKLLPDGVNKTLLSLLGLNGAEHRASNRERISPFDQEFYLSVGLAVGGVRNFPDGIISGGKTKPWSNIGTKAMANFYKFRNDWIKTWSEDKTLLEVDSIQVVAL